MKTLLLLGVTLNLASCSFIESHQTQIAETAKVLAKRAAAIAGRVILNAAVSKLDGQTKGDFLDSAAAGLRSEIPNIVTAGDVASVVRIWTPEKPHWSQLAEQVAAEYQATPGTPAQKVEAIAVGLNAAASSTR